MVMCFANQHLEGYILHASTKAFHNLQAPSSINHCFHDATCKQKPHLQTLTTETLLLTPQAVGLATVTLSANETKIHHKLLRMGHIE